MKIHQWRDCQAWRDEGLQLSTRSNEAAKLYDACVSQYVGWYDEVSVGGMERSCEKMYQADPHFVLGLSLNLGLQLLGTEKTIKTDRGLKLQYDNLKLSLKQQKDSITCREVRHAQAVLSWAEGEVYAATRIWQDILIDHPTDLHALKISQDSYFWLGDSVQIRDSVGRVLSEWEEKQPLMKGHVYGMYAFGLEENDEYEKAEIYAQKGLDENEADGWSTHSMAHIFEMGGRTVEGLKFMNETVQNWTQSNRLAGHNFWHVALYHLENEDYDAALDILEKKVMAGALESKSVFQILDGSSLLWRINLLSPSTLNGRVWTDVSEICRPWTKNHVAVFNDTHFMMAFVGSGEDDCGSELLETLPQTGEEDGDLYRHGDVTGPLLQSFAEFGREQFHKVVELLEPIRSKLRGIGGSNAQRDVFNLMLIIAALRSHNPRHKKLAKVLIHERDAYKGKQTPLTFRLRGEAAT